MKVIPFPAPIFISKFKQHNYFKRTLLDIFDQFKLESIKSGNLSNGESIYKSDWHLGDNTPSNENKKYWHIIYNDIFFHIKEILTKLELEKIIITEVWFQQYTQNDFHSLHVHTLTSWNVVYYLEFEKNAPGTSFKNFFDSTLFTPDIEEGDIIIFPSFIRHTSLPNKSTSRKTIIACNIA